MFLPTTRHEMDALGWSELDVILVTGDAYIDSPFIGISLIGKYLVKNGYRVGVIGQPDIHSAKDISRLGEPKLFWGVSSGCMDSMVANYTALKKRRKKDDLTAGGINDRRPDMAVIVYCNLIRRYFKHTRPIVIGGIEASLRRISHFDYWKNTIRRSILVDARADILVYGMGEQTVAEIARRIQSATPLSRIPGTCVIASSPVEGYLELPAHSDVAQSKSAFREMCRLFYRHGPSPYGPGLYQKQDTRYLIHHPPPPPMDTRILDAIYEMDFERDVHPWYAKQGTVPGIETFRFAITTHRGCFGQCNFCGISVHQGRLVVSRSPESIIREARTLTRHRKFKGIISDVGGPTANMYAMGCDKQTSVACPHRRCLHPKICSHLKIDHQPQMDLLKRIRHLDAVRKVFVASGIRHDLVMHDTTWGIQWLRSIARHHISGQLKLAPEHCQPNILQLMGKPDIQCFTRFKQVYDQINRQLNKPQFISCYFIAAYPGCTQKDMAALKRFVRKQLKFKPRQVQIFTPTPSTPATLMFYTETDLDGNPIFVEKRFKAKQAQKQTLTG